MRERIEPNWSEKELDRYLKENYGCRYAQFAKSLEYTNSLYSFRNQEAQKRHISEEIKKLKKIKEKIYELFDEFLEKINFYKFSKVFRFSNGTVFKWTTDKRRDFIKEIFKLYPTFSAIDELIIIIKKHSLPNSYSFFKRSIYLKPSNFIIMVWSHVLKKGDRIDWINIEGLLKWFSLKSKKLEISDFFSFIKDDLPSPERMRFIYNKYRKKFIEDPKTYRDLAFQGFLLCFVKEITNKELILFGTKKTSLLEKYLKYGPRDAWGKFSDISTALELAGKYKSLKK